jgi:lipid-A-disaccharide synthase-like uncharacterized protein
MQKFILCFLGNVMPLFNFINNLWIDSVEQAGENRPARIPRQSGGLPQK